MPIEHFGINEDNMRIDFKVDQKPVPAFESRSPLFRRRQVIEDTSENSQDGNYEKDWHREE